MITDAVGEQILADVIAHPDDDSLRRVYADWCEDAGQAERAEFVRVQIELAAWQGEMDSIPVGGRHRDTGRTIAEMAVHGERLRRCEGELLAKHGHDWLKAPGLATYSSWHGFPVEGLLPKKKGGPGIEIGVTVRRGFIEEVGCTLEQWLDHGPALVRAHPLRKVVLTDCRQEHIDPEGGHYEGWVSLFGAANPPPGADLQNFFAGPPFSHKLWHGLARALRFGLRYDLTREAAAAFLSDNALAWARAEAQRRDLAAALSVTGRPVV